MTINDWLTSIRKDLQEVVRDNSTFTKGVRSEVEGVSVSVTLTKQPDKYEAYVVAEPTGSSSIIDAKQSVRTIQRVIGNQTSEEVATEKRDRWAEKHFEVESKEIKRL
jgi:hypothetical protein